MSDVRLEGKERAAAAADQAKRCRLACAVVGFAAAVLVACGALEASARGDVAAEASVAASAASFDAVMDGEEVAFALPECIPKEFSEELFDPRCANGVHWSADSQLVGWCEEGSAEESLAALADQLAQKGWSEVPSNVSSCRSFSKSSGEYRWAFASAAQIGQQASIVLQWSCAKDGGV